VTALCPEIRVAAHGRDRALNGGILADAVRRRPSSTHPWYQLRGGPAVPAQLRDLAGDQFIEPAFVESLFKPGYFGQQVSPRKHRLKIDPFQRWRLKSDPLHRAAGYVAWLAVGSVVVGPSAVGDWGVRLWEFGLFGAGGKGGGDVVPGGAVAADFEDVLGEHALGFADSALRQALPTEQEAEVRLSIASLFSLSPDVRAESCRRALAPHGLPPDLRARLLT
jgi:hypothetical protein